MRHTIPVPVISGHHLDRFLNLVEISDDGCWYWQGSLVGGYGQFVLNHRKYYAHRISYTAYVGEIPDGLPLDHTCEHRNCVNPEHLEIVTDQENTRRVWQAIKRKA